LELSLPFITHWLF